LLVIITGAPATGKTTLGRRIAGELGLPFICKDGIKERLFDTLGWGDQTWSKRLSRAAMEVLYYTVAMQLEAGRSLVSEANFYPHVAQKSFLSLRERHVFCPFQILCQTDVAVLAQRYRSRVERGGRHPGHRDQIYLDQDAKAVQGMYGPLDIGGTVVVLDTTDFATIDYDGLIQAILSAG
jgi:predicted kinase